MDTLDKTKDGGGGTADTEEEWRTQVMVREGHCGEGTHGASFGGIQVQTERETDRLHWGFQPGECKQEGPGGKWLSLINRKED